MARPEYEAGNTPLFKWASKVAPDSFPTFTVFQKNTGILVNSFGFAVQSDATHFFALVTMPGSEQELEGVWSTVKTFSGVVYPLVKRFEFAVKDELT